MAGCSAIRAAWVALAAFLYQFQDEEMWGDLGYSSFEEWLASPDVSLGRSHVYVLIEAHRELVVEREVDPDELRALDVSKIGQVLPAIRRGTIEVEEALNDVKVLSRSDLRERYRKKGAPGKRRSSTTLEKCDLCGKQRIADDDERVAEVDENQMEIEDA